MSIGDPRDFDLERQIELLELQIKKLELELLRKTQKPKDKFVPWKIKRCNHPVHNPPSMMVFPPEGYHHRCPGCGWETVVYGNNFTCCVR